MQTDTSTKPSRWAPIRILPPTIIRPSAGYSHYSGHAPTSVNLGYHELVEEPDERKDRA